MPANLRRARSSRCAGSYGIATAGLGSPLFIRCGRAVPLTSFRWVGSGLRPTMTRLPAACAVTKKEEHSSSGQRVYERTRSLEGSSRRQHPDGPRGRLGSGA